MDMGDEPLQPIIEDDVEQAEEDGEEDAHDDDNGCQVDCVFA